MGLRLTGLDHGLPHRMEPDAEVVTQVEVLRGEHQAQGALRAGNYGTYPLLIARLTTLLWSPEPDPGPGASLAEHRVRAADNFLDTRRTVAVTSVLLVPATFLLGCYLLAPGWALFAAALVAFSLLDQNFAQQARSHGLLAPMICFTALAALRLRRRGDWGSYVLAAVCCALALGCLHSAVALWPALLAAHFLAPGKRGVTSPKAWLAIALIIGSIPVFYPFVFEGASDTEVGIPRMEGSSLWLGNHEIDFALFNGQGVGTIVRSFVWYEPVLGGLVVLAAVAWLLRRRGEREGTGPSLERGDRIVILVYVLPYLGVIALFSETFERFLMPLLPFFACFAAWGASQVVGRVGRVGSAGARRALVAGFCLLLALPASACARLAWLRTRADTVAEAAVWIEENLEPGAEPIFLSPVPSAHRSDSSMELPLMRTEEGVKQARGSKLGLYNIWSVYQLGLDEQAWSGVRWPIRWLVSRVKDLAVPPGVGRLEHLEQTPTAFFASSGPGIFVIEVYEQRVENPTHVYLREALQQLGTRLVRFSPDPEQHDTRFPFLYQDRVEDGGAWPNYMRRCFTARTTGPVVEIYRVTAEALEGATLGR